jgi:hypothetical protein
VDDQCCRSPAESLEKIVRVSRRAPNFRRETVKVSVGGPFVRWTQTGDIMNKQKQQNRVPPKKLALRRESLRQLGQLTEDQLGQVAGGDGPIGIVISRGCRDL